MSVHRSGLAAQSLFRLPDRVRHPKDAHWDEKLPCREVPQALQLLQKRFRQAKKDLGSSLHRVQEIIR